MTNTKFLALFDSATNDHGTTLVKSVNDSRIETYFALRARPGKTDVIVITTVWLGSTQVRMPALTLSVKNAASHWNQLTKEQGFIVV